MSLILPDFLRARAQATPAGFSAAVSTVVTDAGVTLELRVFDPRDPYKRQHAVRVELDTLSPPKDAPASPA